MHILFQIETNPIKMHFEYFFSGLGVFVGLRSDKTYAKINNNLLHTCTSIKDAQDIVSKRLIFNVYR